MVTTIERPRDKGVDGERCPNCKICSDNALEPPCCKVGRPVRCKGCGHCEGMHVRR